MNQDDSKIAAEPGVRPSRKPVVRADRDVGQALRSVYTETVAEDIPADILDLLGKLD